MYTFKFWQEAAWGAALAALTFALSAFIDAESLDRAFVVALVIGAARAAAGFLLSRLSPAP